MIALHIKLRDPGWGCRQIAALALNVPSVVPTRRVGVLIPVQQTGATGILFLNAADGKQIAEKVPPVDRSITGLAAI
jgi:hypothetical protein